MAIQTKLLAVEVERSNSKSTPEAEPFGLGDVKRSGVKDKKV